MGRACSTYGKRRTYGVLGGTIVPGCWLVHLTQERDQGQNCENGNEPAGSIKYSKIHEWLNN
jgi:hypothetical protein